MLSRYSRRATCVAPAPEQRDAEEGDGPPANRVTLLVSEQPPLPDWSWDARCSATSGHPPGRVTAARSRALLIGSRGARAAGGSGALIGPCPVRSRRITACGSGIWSAPRCRAAGMFPSAATSNARSPARASASGPAIKDVSSIGQGIQQASPGTSRPRRTKSKRRYGTRRAPARSWNAREAMLASRTRSRPGVRPVVAALILQLTDRGERLGDVLDDRRGGRSRGRHPAQFEAKRTQPRFAVRFFTG